MSPFQLPENDPLLDDELSSDKNGASDQDQDPADASDPLVSADANLDEETIFDEGKAQIVVRSEEDISSGQLAGLDATLRHFSRQGLFHLLDKLETLNELLREGWSLERIEFRNPPSASLAFIVTRDDRDE